MKLLIFLCLLLIDVFYSVECSVNISPIIPQNMGINIHFTDPNKGELQTLKAAGWTFARMDFMWAATEKQKGVYEFGSYDTLLRNLKSNNMRGLWILDYSNPLYDNGKPPSSQEARDAMARWAANATLHFRGNGILWEMWNEPNGGWFWPPTPNPTDYAALAVAVGKAIKAATPAELFIGPATSTIDMNFLEAIFKLGVLNYFDAVSVHPYRQTAPETSIPEYENLRNLIQKYRPNGGVDVISGEWGYSDVWANYDETRQAKYLARMMLVNSVNRIALSIWYDWHDDCTDPKNPECHFGTVLNAYNPNGPPYFQPKPSYTAAQTLMRILSGSQPQSIILNNPQSWIVSFYHPQSKHYTYVAWNVESSGPKELSFNLVPADGNTCFSAVDYLGHTQERICVDSPRHLKVPVTDSPLYLVPSSN